jgi:hypothetical protein
MSYRALNDNARLRSRSEGDWPCNKLCNPAPGDLRVDFCAELKSYAVTNEATVALCRPRRDAVREKARKAWINAGNGMVGAVGIEPTTSPV